MRLRHLALAFIGAALIAPPCWAANNSDLQAAFGNTIVSTYPDGRIAKLWLKPDGAYDAQGRRGAMSSGRWTIKGDKLCMKQGRPIALPFSFCSPIVHVGAGESWSARAVTGEPIRVTVIKGGAPPSG